MRVERELREELEDLSRQDTNIEGTDGQRLRLLELLTEPKIFFDMNKR